MTKGDLPGLTVFGRPLKPVAFGLTLAMVIVAQSNFRGADRGTEYPLSVFLGFAAVAAIVTLIVGWVCSRQRVAEAGLLLVVGVYVTRAAFIQMYNPWDQAVFFSLSTAIIAAGSYMLEATSTDRRRRG
jgi:hypothetical protein